ncbi:MAG: transcriptional repressor NrdR [Candidatus Wildermuthbacteria bacterium]|nr:transcriptional repressor NrdR [Candidatus Wildermuthbacteria bacterium]
MRCPICHRESRVTNSRIADQGRAIKRRRVCVGCRRRFTTYERAELVGTEVLKRDGSREPYYRHKLELGLRKALEKRPLTEAQFQKLISAIEGEILNQEKELITSEEIGQIALSHLKSFDKVAYLRFASVYRNFRSPHAFEREIEKLSQK